jgi:hypothetical protein
MHTFLCRMFVGWSIINNKFPTSDAHFAQNLIGPRDYPVISDPARTPCRDDSLMSAKPGRRFSADKDILYIINIILLILLFNIINLYY